MPEEKSKKRLNRTKRLAAKHLEKMGYKPVPAGCVIGIRASEIRIAWIVVEKMTDADKRVLRSIPAPNNLTKEIWIRRASRGGPVEFEIHPL